MNEVCKVCAAGVGSSDRRNLVRRAGGVREVYGLLLDTLVASCSRPERLAAAHGFLSADPACLCKGCFTTLKKFCDLEPQVILLHHHPPQGGAQEKLLSLQQLHWLLNVSVQLSRPCNFAAHWGHVVTKRGVLALLLVELREKGCRSSHTHHQTMARILLCVV